jgi:hypothetical protein
MKRPDRLLEELQTTLDRNVFVMMRYADTPQFHSIETSIRDSLARYGLIARLAKDRALSDDLWENIRLYMTWARYGIGVFEEIDRREFNPNISLELGYMYALGRRCLLLKDKRMPRLPTDMCGKIYRDFDTSASDVTVSGEVAAWCETDLGLTRIDATPSIDTTRLKRLEHTVYDSNADENFSTWGLFDSSRSFRKHIQTLATSSDSRPGTTPGLELSAHGTEFVGANRKVDVLHGVLSVEYRAVSSEAKALNMYVCVIPMKGAIDDLVEVGATRVDEPENAFSPYRMRHFVPHHHIGDGQWHAARIEFDFHETPTASYAIGAIRINEGCPRPGPGCLQVRNVRIATFVHV